jgi:hypothetical protein
VDRLPPAARRIAWLLRANRLLSGDAAWARTSVFADAFRGGCHPDRVSVSTVSRWETAALRAPFLAVRRCEELLEFPPGLLASTADMVYRFAAPTPGGPPILDRSGPHLVGPAAYARLDELLERALSSDMMDGAQWDELTGHLSAIPTIAIFPSRLWTELAGRLLDETIIADGLPWLQRFEAINRLLGHPVSGIAAVAACASLAADPSGQVYIEPVSLLEATIMPTPADTCWTNSRNRRMSRPASGRCLPAYARSGSAIAGSGSGRDRHDAGPVGLGGGGAGRAGGVAEAATRAADQGRCGPSPRRRQ